MQLSIKTLTGRTLTLEVTAGQTWGDLKRQIAEREGISVAQQLLILAGQQMNDNDQLNIEQLRRVNCIHLVIRQHPQFGFITHSLYIAAHNFYEDVGGSLAGLQKVMPVLGDESLEELVEKFETMYGVREARIAKNRTHDTYENTVTPPPSPVIALVAVEKNEAIAEIPEDGGIYSLISQQEDVFLSYELLSYMLENGRSVMSQDSYNENHCSVQLNNINRAFRLFSATKLAEDPQYQEQIQEDVRSHYGEISAYFEMTADMVFDDKSPEEILAIIREVRKLSLGIRPQEDNPFYEDILNLDLIAHMNDFQLVKNRLAGTHVAEKTAILEEMKTAITSLLNNKLNEYEQRFANRVQPAATPVMQQLVTPQPVVQQPVIQQTDHGRQRFFQAPPSLLSSSLQISYHLDSSLSIEQYAKVEQVLLNLRAEIDSNWPYFNKARKAVKAEALERLIELANTQALSTALETVKNEYRDQGLLDGYISTRTKDLFNELERSCIPAPGL